MLLISFALPAALLLNGGTTFDELLNGAHSLSILEQSDDRLSTVKDRRSSSTKGFAMVPENPAFNNSPLNIKSIWNDPPIEDLMHVVYHDMPVDPLGRSDYAFKVPLLTIKGIPTPPQQAFFNDDAMVKIHPSLASDPRRASYAKLIQEVQLIHHQTSTGTASISLTNIDGSLSQLWIARDAINWRTRWITYEYGLLIVVYLNGIELTVATCPMQAGDVIRKFPLNLTTFKSFPRVERLAITNVHDGVIVVEGLVQRSRGALAWVASVVRIASFHPYYRHASKTAAQQEQPRYNVPSWPLISKRVSAFQHDVSADAYLNQCLDEETHHC